jgi:hypothetical protein
MMPELRSVGDASKAISALLSAVTNGELGAGEAAEVAKLIETYVRAVEATELEQLATFSLRSTAVHRRVRHARSEGGQGVARRAIA